MFKKKLFLSVIVILSIQLFLPISTGNIFNIQEQEVDTNIHYFHTIQRDGSWVQGTYGTYTLEPSGTGNHYLYAKCIPGEEASYITPALDLSGLTTATISFAYSHSAEGVAVVVSYSGGVNTSDYEERLLFKHEYNTPGAFLETIVIDPSTYTKPDEVYLEFYYFCSYGNNDPPGLAIDDIEISEIGFSEGFEIMIGSLSGYVKDQNMEPIQDARVRVYFHGTYEENYTNSDGYYHVTNIPLCWCFKNATASKQGYKTEWILLVITENTTYDFVLTTSEICGDTNRDSAVNIADLTAMVAYLFGDGPEPNPLCTGDVNGDSNVNIADLTYLVGYLFGSGPAPMETLSLIHI